MRRSAEMLTYTDKEYWENYYKESGIDIQRVVNIVSKYDCYWEKMVKSCARKPGTLIEIGAYPGRYISYIASKYGLKPTALDYNSDTSRIEACFRQFGIKDFELIQTDFLNYTTIKQYDLVLSNGFIEHFSDFDRVMDLHCNYLSPGGSLLIMIPNKRFLRKFYSLMVDRKNLGMHNLKTMNLELFRNFAKRNNLKIEHLGYYGGFNFNTHQKLNLVQRAVKFIFRMVFKKLNPVISNHPNKYLSSTIISIFSKPL